MPSSALMPASVAREVELHANLDYRVNGTSGEVTRRRGPRIGEKNRSIGTSCMHCVVVALANDFILTMQYNMWLV